MTTGVWQSETAFNPTNIEDLTDGENTTLHYHASDRNRTNHTGTQLASTISDFQTAVDSNTKLTDLTDGGVTTLHKHDIVTDTTPKLGGDLDCQGFMIINSRTTTDVYGLKYNMLTDVVTPGYVIGGVFLPVEYSAFPVQEKIGRGLLTSAGVWTKLNRQDTTKYIDGSAAVLDGSAGQVMVQIPSFHQLITTWNNEQYFLVSEAGQFSFKGVDSWVPLAFQDQMYRYIGAFNSVALTDSLSASAVSAVIDTSAYTTNIYPNPFSNRTRAQFRAQQQSGFFQYSWGLYEIIRILFLTKYKTWNSQRALPGYTEGGTFDYAKCTKAGATLGLGDLDGSIWDAANSRYKANSFLGIENPFGNVQDFLDGINIDNTAGLCTVYTCNTPANFADDTGSNYVATGHSPAFGDTDDYQKYVLGSGKDCPFYPAALGSGATSTTYQTDYHYNAAGGWRVLSCGGYLSNGAPAGLAFLTATNASSAAASLISARSAA